MNVSDANQTTAADRPEEIPSNYDELFRDYGAFIAAAVRKHNKVGRNFDEMYAHVQMRLVEKDVISLFMQNVAEKLPQRMTAVQACEFLGVKWKQWEVKMWTYHAGDPIYSKDRTRIIGRRQGGWMPTPINSDEFRTRIIEQNEKRAAKGLAPKVMPDCPGCQSKNAIFDIDDIITLSTDETLLKNGTVRGAFAKQGPCVRPEMKATKAHFQAYLSKSIYSDFANWCRTYARKWSQDRPMYHREGDNNDANWEADLIAPGGARQETQAVLREAVTKLSETLYENMKGADTLKCKPVAQTEMQMYELLERGVPLPEVLRKLDVPERVRRAVLKSIVDIRGVRAA